MGGLQLGRVIDEHRESLRPGRLPAAQRARCRPPQRGRWPWATSCRWARRCSSICATPARPTRTSTSCSKGRRADGALVFTCNGRGSRLFDEPHHDARVLADLLGPVPLAGFFAAGEIGPVGGHNFVHGFTASMALLSDTVDGRRVTEAARRAGRSARGWSGWPG